MPYENVAVPFKIWGNRQVLTEHQLAEMPFLCDFVSRFKNCFEHDAANALWIFYPEGDAPTQTIG